MTSIPKSIRNIINRIQNRLLVMTAQRCELLRNVARRTRSEMVIMRFVLKMTFGLA